MFSNVSFLASWNKMIDKNVKQYYEIIKNIFYSIKHYALTLIRNDQTQFFILK